MAGSKIGGLQAAETNKKEHGEDFYAVIGAKGGRARNPNKGFGADRERARAAGRIGGERSRRPSKK